MLMTVLSWVPWWLYAICAVVAYFAARHYLGEKIALVYAVAAAAWVAMDYGGDAREAWLRERTEVIVQQADTHLNARAEADWAERLARMAAEAKADKEKLDALEASSPDGCSPVPDDILRGMR